MAVMKLSRSCLTDDDEKRGSDESQDDSDHLDDQPGQEVASLPLEAAHEEEDVAQGQDDPHDQGPDPEALVLSICPFEPDQNRAK